MPPAGRDIQYDANGYPEATRLLNDSLLIGSERYPLAGQNASVMPYVIAAVRKVHAAIEQVIESQKV
jgi:hypothetical protein